MTAALRILAAFAAATPMFMAPQALPVERLVRNLERYIEEKPDDPQLHYNMARLHYLALANRSFLVPAFERNDRPPYPAPGHMADRFLWSLRYEEAERRARESLDLGADAILDRPTRERLTQARTEVMAELEEQDWRPPEPDIDVLDNHAEQAIAHFDTAIELDPDNPLYHLGRASLGEQCLDLELAGKLPRRRVFEGLEDLTYGNVRDQYYETFRLALQPELEVGHLPVEGIQGLVSHEAAQAYLRMVEKPELAEGQDERVAEVKAGLEKLKGLRMAAITPILVGTPGDSLADLLAPETTVSFDLDGLGRGQSWPWVRPETGILVWDPYELGRIESGRQLFGSVTFFLFHRHGYEALRLLDDDGDGKLSGVELEGLAVWQDGNSNGISEPSEVRPVWKEGITAIATRGRLGGEGVLHNLRGVTYEDGRRAPTFDWVVSPRPGTPDVAAVRRPDEVNSAR